jgi:hypothetical protein
VIRNGFLDLRFDLRPKFIHGSKSNSPFSSTKFTFPKTTRMVLKSTTFTENSGA